MNSFAPLARRRCELFRLLYLLYLESMQLESKDTEEDVKSEIEQILKDFSSIVEEFSADLIDFSVLAQCNVSINTYGKWSDFSF